jgi:hypothetical protein
MKMKAAFLVVSLLTVVILALGPGPAALAAGHDSPALKKSGCGDFKACFEIGVRAYVYGYPLVMMGVTERVMTNVPDATTVNGRAPINQFANSTALMDASYTDIVYPNVNTLYSFAWLDLSKEPVIMHLPEVTNRFFLMQTMDAWSNVIPNSPGTRMDSHEGNYAYVGPDWRGSLPKGITQAYRMPTNTVWIAGRVYTDGSADDIATIVSDIQPQFTLTPLHKFGKKYTPPAHSPVDRKADTTASPVEEVAKMDAGAFFSMLATLLRSNPPSSEDGPMVAELAQIGIVPGRPFEIKRLDPTTRRALEDAVPKAYAAVKALAHHHRPTTTNWDLPLALGDYGTEYLIRAAVAYGGLGANYYEDAVYATAVLDAGGLPLSGAGGNQYELTFAADALPPVEATGFWSATMYNYPSGNLAANDLNRYALGIPAVLDHELCYTQGEPLTLYIQADPPSSDPGSTEYCNWLPAPEGDFLITLRMYMPGDALFDQVNPWIPPAVVRVN